MKLDIKWLGLGTDCFTILQYQCYIDTFKMVPVPKRYLNKKKKAQTTIVW